MDRLNDDELTVLLFCDRGTKGLGGPTRADDVTDGIDHDYVSFALNVGDPPDTDLGGGTYGFGKAVFFSLSRAWSILVHTHCVAETGVESRMIGMALGSGFSRDGLQYTGRHWWGVQSEEIVRPLLGPDADQLAAALSLPPFAPGETGTTVAVIAPELGDRTDEAAMEWIVQAMQWHLWPKMLSDAAGVRPMELSASIHGRPLEVASPSEHPVLKQFVRVFERIDTGTQITYSRQPIGRLNIESTFAPPPEIDLVGAELGFGGGVRHTCLLRHPRLVVTYQPGPPTPDGNVWYAGTFLAETSQDETFAAAEPPTHDAWNFGHLPRNKRGIVRRALEEIAKSMTLHATPAGAGETGVGRAEGLAGISRALGALLAPAPADAAGPGGGSPRGTRPRSPIATVGAPRWSELDGRSVLVQAFEVSAARRVTVESRLTVTLWGGGSPGRDEPAPTVLGWQTPNGELLRDRRVTVEPGESGRWELIVVPVPESVTNIRVREAKGGGDA